MLGNSSTESRLSSLFDRLFPLTRSIAGPGIEESIRILSEVVPFKCDVVPSGTRVFDWVVPKSWHFKRATLTEPNGRTAVDSDASNLHVVSFSQPCDVTLSLEALQPRSRTPSIRSLRHELLQGELGVLPQS